MTNKKRAVASFFCITLATTVYAQEGALDDADPLFRADDVVKVTITAPIGQLMDERPLEEELPGTLSYVDDTGKEISIEIQIRTRGRYRRQPRICRFAPIRLNVKTEQARNTLFHKQDKLKLVTHCRDRAKRYEQGVLKEYLAYRVFSELTDYSFRVRLLRINYVDVDKPKRERVSYGFVIEHRDRLAKRIGRDPLKIPRTSIRQLAPAYTNLTNVFQYFIANTDYSQILGAADDICCHNTNLFGQQGELLHSIPYDFDMSGFADTPYAAPNEKFKLRSVRQRLYRGYCANNSHLANTLALFRDKEDAILSLIENQPDLSGSSRSSMLSLTRAFYKLINDEKGVDKRIVKTCR